MTTVVHKPGRTRRLLKNFGYLAGGRTAGALLTLTATALTARTLGAEAFGLVVLVHAAAVLTRQLCNVRTSDSIIRYGVPLAETDRADQLKGLVLRFVRIDLAAGLLAAVLGGAGLLLLADHLGLPPDLRAPAALYLPALLIAVTGSARGTLRLLDRFGTLSVQLAIGPLVRLGGVLLVLTSPYVKQTAAYIIVWALAYLIEHVYTWLRAVRAFRQHYRGVRARRPDLDRREVRGFLMTTYWQSTLDAVPKQVSTLLAGTFLGSAGAALFALARNLAEVVAKPVTLLRQVVFPDLARLWLNDLPRFVNVTWRTGAVTAAVGLGLAGISAVAGEPLLVALAGSEFGAGAPLLTLLLLAAAVQLGGAAFRPAAYVMGKAQALLKVEVLVMVTYLLAFIGLVQAWGLVGVGIATVLSSTLGLLGAGFVVLRGVRERGQPAGPADAATGHTGQ